MSIDFPYEEPLPENVVLHPERAGMDLPVSDILRTAYQADLTDCVVLGRRRSGREFFAMTSIDMADTMFMLQRGVQFMNHVADELQASIVDDSPIQPSQTKEDK